MSSGGNHNTLDDQPRSLLWANTYQNQKERCQNDTNTPSKPVDAEPKQNHSEDVADQDRVGQLSLHASGHMFGIAGLRQSVSCVVVARLTAWPECCSYIQ